MNIIIIQTVYDALEGNYRGMGAHQIAWFLRKFGYTVQVINYSPELDLSKINNLLDKFVTSDTKLIGLSGIFIEDRPSFFTKMGLAFKRIKERHPQITFISGGSSVSVIKLKLKKVIDYYFVGHAENTMLQFCNWIFKNGPKPLIEINAEGLKHVKETSYTGEINFTIDECDYRWDDSDCIQPLEALPLETSRGCIFKCKFCSYPLIGKYKKDFLKPMSNIRNEIIDNYERFGTTSYYMLDDTFNADKERLEEFANMSVNLPFRIKYATYLRLDLIEAHPETADMLLDSGLFGAFFGIESFHPEASKLVGKPFSGKKAKEFLPYLIHDKWKDQVHVTLGLIAGIPPETYEELIETQDWCVENGIKSWRFSPLGLNALDSYYLSEFDRNAEKYGFKVEKISGTLGASWTHTSGITSEVAVKWAKELLSKNKNVRQRGGWSAIQALQYGYTPDEVKNLTIDDYKISWKSRVKNFHLTYYNMLMQLS